MLESNRITKTIILTLLFIFVFSCKQESSLSTDINNSKEVFDKNCETIKSYVQSFCIENIDYERFFSDSVIIKGTTYGAKNEMNVEDQKLNHKQLWKKYEFFVSYPLNILPGVNPETKQPDGSARLYANLVVKLKEPGKDFRERKTVVIPMYESFDFDDNGKIIYYQYYGDFTASLQSLER